MFNTRVRRLPLGTSKLSVPKSKVIRKPILYGSVDVGGLHTRDVPDYMAKVFYNIKDDIKKEYHVLLIPTRDSEKATFQVLK